MKISLLIHVADADDLAECLAAHRAGIHAQRAAHLARDALEPLEAGDQRVARRVGEFLLLHARAGDDPQAPDLDLAELAAREVDHRAGNAAVAHQEIRPAPDYEKRDRVRRAMPDKAREAGLGLRLEPELRGAAHAQRVVCGASGS